MSNLAVIENKSLTIWENPEDLRQIKTIFAKDLTDLEFTIFVEMGKATGLNPFLKEIWAVKYDKTKPAQIFIGRDGYRKSAQRSPFYDYHLADAVYSNDEFKMDNGVVSHKYNLKERGSLVGAYCTAQRKNSSHPTFVYVEFSEYNLKQSVWNQKPATMIKKVAEAQALKMAFQELFAGSYNEFEEYEKPDPTANKPGKGVAGLKEKLGMKKEAENCEVMPDHNQETGEVIDAEFDIFADEVEPELSALDNIKSLMTNASTTKELLEAAKKGNDLPEEDKKVIRALFNKKSAEFKNG